MAKNDSNNQIIILRTRKCRKSNLIKFLEDEQVPHVVKSLKTGAEAQRLAKKLNILSSPGIVVNGQAINPYQLIENCQIKDREKAKELLGNLMNEKRI